MKLAEHLTALDYADLHPELRDVLERLDNFCAEIGAPEVFITSLTRTKEQNAKVGGAEYSWHLFACAADLRSNHLTATQRTTIWTWLAAQCPRPLWELLYHSVNHGLHFHLARRDFVWRKRQGAK